MNWISIKDGLPKEHHRVIILTINHLITVGAIDSEGRFSDYCDCAARKSGTPVRITHWMPLPDAPNK